MKEYYFTGPWLQKYLYFHTTKSDTLTCLYNVNDLKLYTILYHPPKQSLPTGYLRIVFHCKKCFCICHSFPLNSWAKSTSEHMPHQGFPMFIYSSHCYFQVLFCFIDFLQSSSLQQKALSIPLSSFLTSANYLCVFSHLHSFRIKTLYVVLKWWAEPRWRGFSNAENWKRMPSASN